MTDQFPVVCRDGKAIVYKVGDAGLITDEFVRKLVWPEGIKACIFTFDSPIADEAALNSRVTYSEDFSFHIRYGAEKEWLDPALPAGNAVKAAELPLDLHKVLYLKIKNRIFSQLPWMKENPAEDREELEKVERVISKYKVGYWEHDGAPAGLIALKKWHGVKGEPADWISWLLVEEALPPEARAAVHAHLRGWLRANMETRLECVVQSFNVRSLKFFRKLGFRPEAVHVYKER
jgi:RimJ/RimL family protein N-acetyltransferase